MLGFAVFTPTYRVLNNRGSDAPPRATSFSRCTYKQKNGEIFMQRARCKINLSSFMRKMKSLEIESVVDPYFELPPLASEKEI